MKTGEDLLRFFVSWKFVLALASFAVMALLFSWKFSFLIMLTIGVHEYGHVWAMRRSGMKTKGFYFLPLIGGAAVSLSNYPSRKAEVYVALMGPFWGLVLALMTYAAWKMTDLNFLAAAVFIMAAINLFNLIPINPLDGGRVLRAIFFSISPRAALIYLASCAAMVLFFWLKTGIFVLAFVLLLALYEFSMDLSRVKLLADLNKNGKNENADLNGQPPEIQEKISEVRNDVFKTRLNAGGMFNSAFAYLFLTLIWLALLNHSNLYGLQGSFQIFLN